MIKEIDIYFTDYEDAELFRFDLQLFSAEDEGRTEEPTEKKLREEREKGKVAKTQELAQAIVVITGCLVIFVFSSWIYESLAAVTRHYLTGFAGKDPQLQKNRLPGRPDILFIRVRRFGG